MAMIAHPSHRAQRISRTRPEGALLTARRALRRAMRRALTLITASGLVPGLGLVGTRYRPLGLLMTGLALAGAGTSAWWGATHGWGSVITGLLTQPDLFIGIAGAALVGCLVWMYAVLLTRRGTEARVLQAEHRRAVVVLTAAMCVLALVTSGLVVRAALAARSFVTGSFGSGAAASAAGKTATTKLGTGTAAWAGIDRVTLLVVGTDGSAAQAAAGQAVAPRTTSVSLMSVVPATGATTQLSVPVDLQHLPLPAGSPLAKTYPAGYTCANAVAPGGGPCTLGTLWADAEAHKDLFKTQRNPGLRTLREEVESVTGIAVDNVVVVDTSAAARATLARNGVIPSAAEGTGATGASGTAGALCTLTSTLGVSPVSVVLHAAGLSSALGATVLSDIPVSDLAAWQQLLSQPAVATPNRLALGGSPANALQPDVTGMRAASAAALSGAQSPGLVSAGC